MIEILAALSAAAAVGVGRIALPLLMIGLMNGTELWNTVPLLGHLNPSIVLGVLVSWSLFELFASTRLWGQRILQVVQLVFSPIVGALVGIAIVKATPVPNWLAGIIGSICALLALVLQLVLTGWFYRHRGLPLWAVFVQDALCVILIFFAFRDPRHGGLVALLLLWLAIRTSTDWRRWHLRQSADQKRPRQYNLDPD